MLRRVHTQRSRKLKRSQDLRLGWRSALIRGTRHLVLVSFSSLPVHGAHGAPEFCICIEQEISNVPDYVGSIACNDVHSSPLRMMFRHRQTNKHYSRSVRPRDDTVNGTRQICLLYSSAIHWSETNLGVRLIDHQWFEKRSHSPVSSADYQSHGSL